MKILLFILSGFLFSLYPIEFKPSNHNTSYTLSAETVYICDSKSATKYHSEENCRGLNACKADIISMDKKDAIKKGRDECGWCW